MTQASSIPEVHEQLLQALLEQRRQKPSFSFIPRKNDDARFRQGLWFLGNEHYVQVGLVNHGTRSQVHCVGFQYHLKKQ